jgi:hypothetical protein
MIKTVGTSTAAGPEPDWLDLDPIANVTVTSEEATQPIERALLGSAGSGWRASAPGQQRVRLQFYSPVTIRRMRLAFEERSRARTQEFTLRWSKIGGAHEQELVRQQYTFAPPETSVEIEEYDTTLLDVEALELTIAPDIRGGDALATLREWRIAGSGGSTNAGAHKNPEPDPDVEARWTAWRSAGAAHEAAVRRKLLRVLPVVVIVAAIVYAVVAR